MKPKLVIGTDCFLPRKDGISRFLRATLPELVKHFDITVLAPNYQGAWDQRAFSSMNIIRFDLSSISLGDFTLSKPTLSTIRQHLDHADLVWTHTLGPIGAATIHYARKKKKQLVSFVHSREAELVTTSLQLGKFSRPILEKLTLAFAKHLYNKCDLIIVPSEDTAEYLQKMGVRAQMKIVHLGVDPNVFSPPVSKTLAKEALRIHPDTFVIGYTGRIGKEKDLITLAKAFLRFRERHKDSLLLYVGDGPEKEKAKLVSANSRVTGFVQNVVPFLHAMDVFVLPSLTETSSLSTMEAMACEVPVIVTPVGHIKTYVINKFNGLVFRKKDVESLTGHLELLYKDHLLRKKLRVYGRKTIITKYTQEKMIKDLTNILLKQAN